AQRAESRFMTILKDLSQRERDTLADIPDVLIPSAHGMPSAREANVDTYWIDEATRLRPDLRDHLLICINTVLSTASTASTRRALELFARACPLEFASVGTLISGAYFMDDLVRGALGYPGQESRR